MELGTLILTVVVFGMGTMAQQEKYPFQTKNKDACVLSPSGQGEIKVKIECKNQGNTYSCVFAGKPSYCRAYNKDPKGFWKQLSQDLKNVNNPCDSQVIKHSKCPKAPSQSQLKQVDDSSPQSDTAKKPPSTQKPSTKKPVATTKAATKSTAKKPVPKKLEQEKENPKAMKIAKERCWWYFQKFCSYIVEIFVS
ncbi:fibroblast growth factor-binding protein 2 [Rhinophrynus dorsalis]